MFVTHAARMRRNTITLFSPTMPADADTRRFIAVGAHGAHMHRSTIALFLLTMLAVGAHGAGDTIGSVAMRVHVLGIGEGKL